MMHQPSAADQWGSATALGQPRAGVWAVMSCLSGWSFGSWTVATRGLRKRGEARVYRVGDVGGLL